MQSIDPVITELKFKEELKIFLASTEYNRRRGILLLEATYPNIIIAFAVIKLKPHPIGFAICFNFDNYDLEPLSARFVDPFTFAPEVNGFALWRKIEGSIQLQNLTQKDETGLPFVCIPGVREYHHHPAHSGDSWLLRRQKGGEGSLGFLVEKLYEYGIPAISSFQVQLAANIPQLQLGIDLNLISL